MKKVPFISKFKVQMLLSKKVSSNLNDYRKRISIKIVWTNALCLGNPSMTFQDVTILQSTIYRLKKIENLLLW